MRCPRVFMGKTLTRSVLFGANESYCAKNKSLLSCANKPASAWYTMNKISSFREKAGTSQTALAEALGWSQGRLSNYEPKRRQPSLADSRAIVAALNRLGVRCTLDQVF